MTETDRNKLKSDVYLNCAEQIARLSKDANTKVGTIIVGEDGTPSSWGYNGMSQCVNDDRIPNSRELVDLSYIKNGSIVNLKSNKYPFISHSEANAISFVDIRKTEGATLYTTGFPCEICAKAIINAKIKRVEIRSNASDPKSMLCNEASMKIVEFHFAEAGIELCVNDTDIQLSIVE